MHSKNLHELFINHYFCILCIKTSQHNLYRHQFVMMHHWSIYEISSRFHFPFQQASLLILISDSTLFCSYFTWRHLFFLSTTCTTSVYGSGTARLFNRTASGWYPYSEWTTLLQSITRLAPPFTTRLNDNLVKNITHVLFFFFHLQFIMQHKFLKIASSLDNVLKPVRGDTVLNFEMNE